MDKEGGATLRLNKEREAIDPEGAAVEFGEAEVEHIGHGRRLGVGYRPGQRHVETELVKDIRIAPAHQVFALARRQAVRLAPFDICLRERRAEGLECLDDTGSERLQRRMLPFRNQGEEWPKLADDNGGDFQGRGFRGERGKLGKQIGFAHAFGQVKGRLERRVKAVSPGIGRQGIQVFRRKIRFGRSWMLNPGEGIASQPSRCRLAQRCVGAGCEV